jgi:hypothetical protein
VNPKYVTVQRRFLYAMIVGRAYALMQDVHAEMFQDMTLRDIYKNVLDCVKLGSEPSREVLINAIHQSALREDRKMIAVSMVGRICDTEEFYGVEVADLLTQYYREHIGQELARVLADPNLTDMKRTEAITDAAQKIVGGGVTKSREIDDLIADYFRRVDSGESTTYQERSIIPSDQCVHNLFDGAIRPVAYVFAAQPGFRKTGVLMNAIVSMANQGKRVKYYSLEDNEDVTTAKYLGCKYMAPWYDLANGTHNREHLDKIREKVTTFKNKVLVDDKQYRIDELLMDMRRACISEKLDAICLDFIQTVSYDRRNEVAELNTLTKGFREIAKGMGGAPPIPFIYTSQVNDRQEDKDTGEVKLTSGAAKGSGSLFEDVRGYYLIHGRRDSDGKNIRCVKNPNGKGFEREYIFDGASGRMMNYSDIENG